MMIRRIAVDFQRPGGGLGALHHEVFEDCQEEGGGPDVEGLEKRLTEYRRGDPVPEIANDLNERDHPGGDGNQH
jgi:hypothetical protein